MFTAFVLMREELFYTFFAKGGEGVARNLFTVSGMRFLLCILHFAFAENAVL